MSRKTIRRENSIYDHASACVCRCKIGIVSCPGFSGSLRWELQTHEVRMVPSFGAQANHPPPLSLQGEKICMVWAPTASMLKLIRRSFDTFGMRCECGVGVVASSIVSPGSV